MLDYGLKLILIVFVKLAFGQLEDNQITGCSNNDFQCAIGLCIASHYKCDGFNDCLDGSDETIELCANKRCPALISFQCAYGGCVEVEKKCDKQEDCYDASDEDPILCGYPTSLSCQPDSFQCSKGGCISNTKLCDGQKDCQDGSDEDPLNCSPQSSNECEQPSKLTNAKCTVVDCEQNYFKGTCTQNMVTKDTCIQLSCDDGYILNEYRVKFKSNCTHGSWEPPLPVCIECGKDNRITKNIEGGELVTQPVPWHVGLYWMNGTKANYFCGGTIVHTKAVITAAHCVKSFDYLNLPVPRFPNNILRVTVGKIYRDYYTNESAEQKYQVADVKTTYYSLNHANDIAILILTESIQITPDVMPICIEPTDDSLDWRMPEPSPALHGTVVGWGDTGSGKESDQLKEANFEVCCNFTLCRRIVEKYLLESVSPDKFCINETEGTRVLQGDSGSGFSIRYGNGRHYLYGLVSVRTPKISIYTYFGYHINWVLKTFDSP